MDRESAAPTGAIVVAGTVGLLAWVATILSVPQYSYGVEEETGSFPLFYVLLGAALIGGLLRPRAAGAIGLALGLPALILSPWTAPRGDGDGLWILIVPLLFVFLFVLVAIAGIGGWIRTRFIDRR
jgi:hypothetical protein